MQAEQERLAKRLKQFGSCQDAPDIWKKMGITDADKIADLTDEDFKRVVQAHRKDQHEAR